MRRVELEQRISECTFRLCKSERRLSELEERLSELENRTPVDEQTVREYIDQRIDELYKYVDEEKRKGDEFTLAMKGEVDERIQKTSDEIYAYVVEKNHMQIQRIEELKK